jgi:hypothetical protein
MFLPLITLKRLLSDTLAAPFPVDETRALLQEAVRGLKLVVCQVNCPYFDRLQIEHFYNRAGWNSKHRSILDDIACEIDRPTRACIANAAC